jgi:RecB family exonuclease
MDNKYAHEKNDKNLPVFSYSKIGSYKSCPKQYKFCYIDKLPRLDKDFTIFGSYCHTVLENFHKFYLDPINENVPHIDAMQKAFIDAKHEWETKEINENQLRITKDQLKEAFQIMKEYLVLLNKGNNPKVISVEKKIWLDIDSKFILLGYIDRIQIDPDGAIHIADYKTTKNPIYLKDRSQLMLYSYSLYCEDNSLSKIRSSFILLKHKMKSLVEEHSIEEIIKCKNKLVETFDTIQEDKLFRATPSSFKCKYCDYNKFCDSGIKMLGGCGKGSFGKCNW